MAIIDYWKSLAPEQKPEFRDAVLKATGMSYPTFYLKIRKNSFSLCEEKVILQLINGYVGAN